MNAFRLLAVIVPLFTSTPGRVIASPQEEFAAPDIFSWSWAGGALDGLTQFLPEDEEIVTDSTFPAAIDPAITHSGRLRYVIDAAEVGAIDRNRSFERESYQPAYGSIENNLEHFFVRQWVKYGTPIDNTILVQRKTIYCRSNAVDNNGWFFIVTPFSGLDGPVFGAEGSGHRACYTADPSTGAPNINLYLDESYTVPWGGWRGMEVEVLCNTPGNSDGRFQIWIYDTDGTVLRHKLWDNFNVRNASTRKLETTMFGNQVNRINTGEAVNELRWINRLAISTTRIGP